MQTDAGRYAKSNDLLKIISIVCFIIFTFALISTRNVPTTGYEASIYFSTPPLFWLAVSLNIVFGTFLIIRQIAARQHIRSNLWVIGFLLLFLALASLLTLWIIRGYANNYVEDAFTHVAIVNYIISHYHTSPDLLYPITHILTAEMCYVFNIPVADFFGYIPFVFVVMFLIFIYALAKSILSSKGAVILTLILAMVAIIGYSNGTIEFAPNPLADLYLPFALYLFVKSSQSGTLQWKIFFFIILFMYPLFHPVPTLALLLIMATVTLGGTFIAILKKRDFKTMRGSFNFGMPAIFFLLVWSMIWFSSNTMWAFEVNNLRNYFSGITTSQITELTQLIGETAEYHYSVLLEFFKIFGVLVILSLISLVTLGTMFKKNSFDIEQKNILSLYGPLAILFLFVASFYFLDLIFSPLRLIPYAALIMAILVGFGFNKLLEQSYCRTKIFSCNSILVNLVFLIIVACFAGNILALYPSRYTLQPNEQVTRTDLQGMEWFFDNENSTYQLSVVNIKPYVYANYLLGLQGSEEQTNLTPVILEPQKGIEMPYHFGYNETAELGEWYSQKSYLLIDQKDRVFFQDVLTEMQQLRFTPEDFERLNQDPSLDLLYSNGGLNIYNVTPLK